MFYRRNATEEFLAALKRSPSVLVGGARQVGKTSFLKKLAQPLDYTYTTLDEFDVRNFAINNPDGFIKSLQKPVILDEVQRAPELPLAIKKDIDENRINGRYALAGSANPLLLPKFSEALVGRMAIIKMYPLSQGELRGHKETFVDQLFSKEPKFTHSPLSRQELCEKIVMGGYPSVQKLSNADRNKWFREYIETMLQRDVQDLARIEGLADIPKILRLMASRVGNLLVVSNISNDAKIPGTTLHRYITLLEKIFVVFFQPAWGGNISISAVKSPKAYFIDTGLLTFFLGLDAAGLLTSEHLGKVLENFVVQELSKQITWSNTLVNAFHFRSPNGDYEVDTVLEKMSGEIVGIEIKASDSVSSKDIKGLLHLRNKSDTKFVRGIMLYTGDRIITLEENIHAVPISALWES